MYINHYYPNYKEIERTVVLYGGKKEEIKEIEVSFLLNMKGEMMKGYGDDKGDETSSYQTSHSNMVAEQW